MKLSLPAWLTRLVTRSGGAPFPFNRIGITDPIEGERLRNPYQNSAWIHRAVEIKSGEISACPLKFIDGDEEIEDPVLADWWAEPALDCDRTRLGMSDVLEALCGWSDLKGEFFLILDDSWLIPFPEARPAGSWAPFIIARADRMMEIIGNKELIGWQYTDHSGKQFTLAPENVLQVKRWNPYNAWRGLAPIETTRAVAEADYLAGVLNRNFMRNNGDAGPIVTLKNGQQLTDEQQEQVIRQLRARQQAALHGTFRGMFFNADVDIDNPKIQSMDANLNQTRLYNRHEIFIALGIPPSMADVKNAYSTGATSDRYQLITGTCISLSKKIAGAFTKIARRQTGRAGIRVEFNWRDHVVMQEVREGQLKSIGELWSKGMPLKQINEFLNLGLQECPGWDQGYIPFSVIPVGEGSIRGTGTADVETDLAATPEPPEEAVKEMLRALRARRASPVCIKVAPPVPPTHQRAKTPQDAARLQGHTMHRRELERRCLSGINRVLMRARAETLQKIERWHGDPLKDSGGKPVTRSAVAAQLTFDQHEFKDGFFAEMKRQAKKALDVSGKVMMEELGGKDDFTAAPEAVLNFVRKRENKLSGVPDEIWEKVRTSIDAGLEAGDSRSDLADRVRDAFNELSRGRATVIAQTETGSAYGQGRQDVMVASGVEWKQWLSAEDDKVRPDHAEADGQAVPVDEPFDVGGEELMHPGDPDGSAEQVINCRCVAIAVQAPDDEEGE